MILSMRKLKYRIKSPIKSKRHKYKKRMTYVRAKKIRLVVNILMIIGIFFIIFPIIFFKAEHRLAPIVDQLAISKLEGMVTLETNKSISHILNENSINYESFIKKSSTNDGKITGLTTDFSMVNAIKSDIAIDMQKRLDTIETVEITVPIGAMFSNTLASGAGIKIPITAIVDDSVEIYFHDDFESVGINQTRHRIMVVVKVPISIAAPLKKISSEVVSEVPIAETVIVGDVPNTYMDFMK